MASFELHGKELAARDKFLELHRDCKDEYLKARNARFGLPFSYLMTPNGIGGEVKIICPYCNKEENITDIDTW